MSSCTWPCARSSCVQFILSWHSFWAWTSSLYLFPAVRMLCSVSANVSFSPRFPVVALLCIDGSSWHPLHHSRSLLSFQVISAHPSMVVFSDCPLCYVLFPSPFLSMVKAMTSHLDRCGAFRTFRFLCWRRRILFLLLLHSSCLLPPSPLPTTILALPKMPSVMPGFAFITGVFGCFNHRVLDPVHKQKTITFDAEIPMGDNHEGVLQCAKGVLHYFVPSHETPPEDDRKFFVSGKVVSVFSGGGDDKTSMDYDLQIEALTMHPLLTSFPLHLIHSLHLQDLLKMPGWFNLIVEQLHHRFVQVGLINNLTGHLSEPLCLPQIRFEFSPPNSSWTVQRIQFPLHLAYASTFHGCVGLTLDRTVLDTRTDVFTHGQLCTSLSRVRNRADTRLLCKESHEPSENHHHLTTNIVYKDLLL